MKRIQWPPARGDPLRASDVLVRIGGDELGVVLIDSDPPYAVGLARRLTALLEQPFVVDGRLVGLHLGRSVTFGDYGVQHSEAPEEARAVNMKANIRYTLETSTLIVRGRSVRDEGAMQYRQLCDEIFSHPDYRRPEFSWGQFANRALRSGPSPTRKWSDLARNWHIASLWGSHRSVECSVRRHKQFLLFSRE